MTLVIQALNFGIAYFMLRTWLLKPVAKIIATERTASESLAQRFTQNQHRLRESQDALELAHQTMLKTLTTYYPHEIAHPVFSFEDIQLKPERSMPTAQEIAALQHEVKQGLVNKVLS